MGPLSSEYFLQWFDADGRVITDTSPNLTEMPRDHSVVASALAGNTEFSTFVVSDDPTQDPVQSDASEVGQIIHLSDHQVVFRVVTEPMRESPDHAIAGALQYGVDRDDVDEPLVQLLAVFALVARSCSWLPLAVVTCWRAARSPRLQRLPIWPPEWEGKTSMPG